MVRALKFLAAMLIFLSIAAELNWITINQPGIEHFYLLFLKAVKIIFYIFIP